MVKKRKSKHKRRDRYWLFYDLACARELSAVISELARLVDEAGDPWPKPKRGRPPVHSNRKMIVICVLTVMLGLSYRNMQSLLNMLKLPWKEPVPDHSTIHHAFKRVPEEYLKTLLEKSAQLCIAESGWTKGVVAPDSAPMRRLLIKLSPKRPFHMGIHSFEGGYGGKPSPITSLSVNPLTGHLQLCNSPFPLKGTRLYAAKRCKCDFCGIMASPSRQPHSR